MSQCRIYYSIVGKGAGRPALKIGKYCLSSPEEHDFQSIARALLKKNRPHLGIAKIEPNGLIKGYRHYTVRFYSGSWVRFAVETHR